MPDLLLVKTDKPRIFEAMDESLDNVQPGEVIRGKFTFARNPTFHNKMFVLFRYIFNQLPDPEPVEFDGQLITPERDFDVTRKQLTIMAGFYDTVATLDGRVAPKAKSLSYAKMESDEFRRVYSAVIDVGIRVLPYNITGEELDRVIENLVLGFA